MDIQVSETGFASPPTTYQEWLECFGYIKLHPEKNATLRSLRNGTICCEGRSLDLFLQRLDNLIQETLNRRISGFMNRVNELLEDSDLDGVEVQAIRFCNGMKDVFFFESLQGIPGNFCMQFSQGYEEQLEVFWKRFVNEFRFQAEQSTDSQMEDLAYRLARLKGIWHRKENSLR